jgi:hypothetical protein
MLGTSKSTALGAYSLIRFRNRSSLNDRFAPKATEFLRGATKSRDVRRSGLLSGKKKKMMPPSACAQA